MYELIIRNGQVVTDKAIQQLDIGIDNNIIAEISPSISKAGKSEKDAEGFHIFPGVVDVHVHLNEPGRAEWEGFKTGSQMLAAGGITTCFDMPLNGIPSTVNREALLQKAAIGNSKSVIDFGLWGGLVPQNKGELAALSASGIVGFKAFMSPTGNEEFEAVNDLELLEGMKRIAELGNILALHAESGPVTTFLTNQKRKQKCLTPDDYLQTRPISAEVEAVEKAIYYAKLTGCPLHFVHISSLKAVTAIEKAKEDGINVSLETCPHYLLFSHEMLKQKGALAKCAPPLRKLFDQEQLITAAVEGKIDFLSSDHSPCPPSLKSQTHENLFNAWGGINGGGVTLLAAIRFAQEEGLPLEQVVEWTSRKPAERFGLGGQKGAIAEGADADIVCLSLQNSHTVTKNNYYAKHAESIYTGETFPAEIDSVFLRGVEIFNKKTGPAETGPGTWLKPERLN